MATSDDPQAAFPSMFLDARHLFFCGATHREVLARLGYLVESGRHCGTIVGPQGTGKSTAIRAFARECRSAHQTAILADMTDLVAGDLLEVVARSLGVTTPGSQSLSELWHHITDALAGQRYRNQRCVVLLDHLDRARPECRPALGRLMALAATSGCATFVLIFSGSGYPVVPREFRQASELRIELGPLSAEETIEFARSLLEHAQLPPDAIDADGLDTLVRLSGGTPRDIVRLCELSLLSALHDDASQISSEIVEAAMRELRSLRPSA